MILAGHVRFGFLSLIVIFCTQRVLFPDASVMVQFDRVTRQDMFRGIVGIVKTIDDGVTSLHGSVTTGLGTVTNALHWPGSVVAVTSAGHPEDKTGLTRSFIQTLYEQVGAEFTSSISCCIG